MNLSLRRSVRASAAVFVSLVGLLVAPLASSALISSTNARPNFALPFPCGEVWYGMTRTAHLAIDFNLLTEDGGRPVVASAAGTATIAEEAGWGSYVLIDHGGGWSTIYAHLRTAGRVSGPVKAGDLIGFVGTTGSSTGNHLHWEQRKDGVRQSPLYANGVALNVAQAWPGTAIESRNCPDNSATTSTGTPSTATAVPPTTAPPTTAPPTTVPPTTVPPTAVPPTTVPPTTVPPTAAPPTTVPPTTVPPTPLTVTPVTVAPTPLVDGFIAAAPRRLLDTRTTARLGTTSTTTLSLSGVPTDAEAVLVGLTAVNPAGSAFLTAYRCGTPRPVVTSLSSRAGLNTAGLVAVQPDASGRICIYSHGATDLVVDLAGWFPASSGYASMTATRLVDTRVTGNKLAPWEVLRVQASRQGDEAAAVVISSVDASASGYVSVWPCDSARPLASALNFTAGTVASNLTIVGLDPQGGLCISASSATHLIVDPSGAFASNGTLQSTSPTRLLDTRTANGVAAAAGSTTRVNARSFVAQGATAVALNLVATQPGDPGFATVYACGQKPPTANLTFERGATIANLVVTALDANGDFCIYSSGQSHYVVDLMGWFGSAPR